MDPVFEAYFRDRLETYWQRPFDLFDRRPIDEQSQYMVRNAIVRARQAAPPDRPLGGDAELLLHLAFSELVAMPVRTVRGPLRELPDSIAADVATITNEAIRNQEGPGRISAHGIVDATGRTWRRLRSSAFQLWDE